VASSSEQSARLSELSRVALLTRRGKLAALQARRLLRWAIAPGAFPAPSLAPATLELPHLLASVRMPLVRADADAHPLFEAGKRHNVALAAPAFDGLLLSPGRPFSFWRTLGRVSEPLGFRHGIELRGGCIVPSIGGGLCLISNALFELAVRADFEILERYGHTMEAVPPGPHALRGLDATVAWPHVDLRFAPRCGTARLSVSVIDDALQASIVGDAPVGSVELSEQHARTSVTPEGRLFENELVRRVSGANGELREEVVATNRKRLLHSEERRRNCLTCDEAACHARVKVAP
jgi:vancomycin resistance protein VanW